jgi:hypothetical protein
MYKESYRDGCFANTMSLIFFPINPYRILKRPNEGNITKITNILIGFWPGRRKMTNARRPAPNQRELSLLSSTNPPIDRV